GIEENRYLSTTKISCEPLDFHDLVFSDLVPHDRYRRHADRIQADDIIEAFHQNDSARRNHLTIPRLVEPACVLTEQFLPAVKIHRELVLVWFLLLASLFGRQRIESLLLQFILRIASDPGQKLAVLAKDRIEDLTAK